MSILNPNGDIEEFVERIQTWVSGQSTNPTIQAVADHFDVPPLFVAAVVGHSYWLGFSGDMTDPATTTIFEEGE